MGIEKSMFAGEPGRGTLGRKWAEPVREAEFSRLWETT